MKLINKLYLMLMSDDSEMTDLAGTIIDSERGMARHIFQNKDNKNGYYRGILAHEAWQLGIEKGKEILDGTKRKNASHVDEQGS